jgi:N-acetylmuramoyl-L-alanine amidase
MPPRRPAKSATATPDREGAPTNRNEVASAPTNTVLSVTNLIPPSHTDIGPAPAPKPKTNLPPPIRQPQMTWLQVSRWAKEHGLEKLARISPAPVETYTLAATNGTLRFSAGNLAASWNGVEFRLGFAPQMIDGQVFVHALDVQKNLEPLLLNRPLIVTASKVIVIDPGHGGINSGTRSVADPRDEKAFTLDWAIRTAALLKTNGWQVFLTRTSDVDISLADRVAFAEEHEADLFVSMHFNSSGGGGRDQSGLETYCLTPAGMASSLTRGYEDDVKQSFSNNAFDEQNFLLALRLHRSILQTLSSVDRGVRRARFLTVLRGQNRPAVLIEGGYLSNPTEAQKIADPAFRQKLAEAVARALE